MPLHIVVEPPGTHQSMQGGNHSGCDCSARAHTTLVAGSPAKARAGLGANVYLRRAQSAGKLDILNTGEFASSNGEARQPHSGTQPCLGDRDAVQTKPASQQNLKACAVTPCKALGWRPPMRTCWKPQRDEQLQIAGLITAPKQWV